MLKILLFLIIIIAFPFCNGTCCASCPAASPSRWCPNLGSAGCNVVFNGGIMTCTCNSGGSCYTTLSTCDSVCPTTTVATTVITTTILTSTTSPSSNQKIKAEIDGLCNSNTERALNNVGSTNTAGICTITSCEVDIGSKKITCEILFNTGNLIEMVGGIHIHWDAIGSIPAGRFDFPVGSFSQVSQGRAQVTNIDAPTLFSVWNQNPLPLIYVNIHTNLNPLGSFAGRLKIIVNQFGSASIIYSSNLLLLVSFFIYMM